MLTQTELDRQYTRNYSLSVKVEGERVVLTGTSNLGDTWTIAMLPSPAVQLSLALAQCARAVEDSDAEA